MCYIKLIILTLGHSVPASTIEQLIEKISKREFHMVTTNLGGWFYEEINKSRVFPFSELRAAVQDNPASIVKVFLNLKLHCRYALRTHSPTH